MSTVQSLKQLFHKRYIRGEVQVFTFAEVIFYEQLLKEEVPSCDVQGATSGNA
jgi:hypothetical protein